MKQTTLITRKYHDGKLYDDIEKKVYYDKNATVYNLTRHTREWFFDEAFPEVFYTVTCVYFDGTIQIFHFDNLKIAFKSFRAMVGFIPISR